MHGGFLLFIVLLILISSNLFSNFYVPTPISFPRPGNNVDIGINASWCESRAHGKQFDYSIIEQIMWLSRQGIKQFSRPYLFLPSHHDEDSNSIPTTLQSCSLYSSSSTISFLNCLLFHIILHHHFHTIIFDQD